MTQATRCASPWSSRRTVPCHGSAKHWYQTAAQAGSSDAMFNLGNLLAYKQDPPDLDGAQRWYHVTTLWD